MISNHNFRPGDTVVLIRAEGYMTKGNKYTVLDRGFWSIKITNDLGILRWVSASAFDHVPRITVIKRHLKRIVLGR